MALVVLVNFLGLTLLFRTLPKVPVRWSHAASGGLVGAIAWEAGRQLLAMFLIGDRYSTYGVVGGLLAVLLWIYWFAVVVYLAAEYVRVLGIDAEAKA